MAFFSFLSWFRPWWKTAETDYESVLNRLTKDIGDVQNRLITINQRERRASVTLTLYAILLWLAYVLFIWFSTSSERVFMSKAQRLQLWLPAIVGLLIIVSVRSLVRWWYLRVSDGEERHLRSLQRARRKKIDEIKQATRFDHLRSLLERYDDTAQGRPSLKRGPSANIVGTPKQQQHNAGQQLQTPSTTAIRGRRQTLAADSSAPRQFEGMRDGVRVRGNAGRSQPISDSLLMQGTASANGKVEAVSSGQTAREVPKIVTTNQAGDSLPFDPPQQQLRFQKTWLDRVADRILGFEPSSQEVAAEQRYALICHVCFTHNGLCPKEDWEEVQYICPRCGTFNSRRPSSVPVTSPWSPARRASAEASVSPARSMHELAPPPAMVSASPSSKSLMLESVSAPSMMSSAGHSINDEADDSRAGDFPTTDSKDNSLTRLEGSEEEEGELIETLNEDKSDEDGHERAVRRGRLNGGGGRDGSPKSTARKSGGEGQEIRKRASKQGEQGEERLEPMQMD